MTKQELTDAFVQKNTGSDIDWSQSIENIDAQLYKKYELSKDEIAFIEKMIKPMK